MPSFQLQFTCENILNILPMPCFSNMFHLKNWKSLNMSIQNALVNIPRDAIFVNRQINLDFRHVNHALVGKLVEMKSHIFTKGEYIKAFKSFQIFSYDDLKGILCIDLNSLINLIRSA